MGDYSRYVGPLPGKETDAGELRRQQRLVQDETRRMIEAVRKELTAKITTQGESISALGNRVTDLEEQIADPEKGLDALDERVTTLEEANDTP